jgi:putative transposase
MRTARDLLYRRHRFPPEVIGHAVWLYFRFPLSLRMVEEMLAARGICVTYETVRQWGKKFGNAFAGKIRERAPAPAPKRQPRGPAAHAEAPEIFRHAAAGHDHR